MGGGGISVIVELVQMAPDFELKQKNSGSFSSVTGFMSCSEIAKITVSGWKKRILFPEKLRGFDIGCYSFFRTKLKALFKKM